MYAGALDERIRAVVPVCSVGTYQSYLHAACCVCEALPGGLRLAEEGDVLSLVAPRALLVINATKDAFQFSVGEAEKSVARARPIFRLYNVEKQLQHPTFESPHAYNQAMREAMYGWMTRWLKGEGQGAPIAEPKHTIEKAEDLACFPDGKRPAGFLFPPTFAARRKTTLPDATMRASVCRARGRPVVPFVGLARQHAALGEELREAFERVVGSDAFILGPEVEAFEREFADYCAARECVGVASGTAALALALTAAGIGPGDEVVVPAHTFIASAFGVIHAVTHGGPGNATEIMVFKLWKDGFIGLNLGSSAAQSVILMAVVIGLTMLQFRVAEKRVTY